MKKYPSQERLKELFDYHPDGYLVWKCGPRNGEIAGTNSVNSELRVLQEVRISNSLYHLHKLIFIYHNGFQPKYVYRADGNQSNNRISNLIGADSRKGFSSGKYKDGRKYLYVQKEKNGTFYNTVGDSLWFYCEKSAALHANMEIDRLNLNYRKNEIDSFDHLKNRCNGKRQIKNHKKRTSEFIGVSKHQKKWTARCAHKYKGVFETEIEAARAYNIAAYEHYGENAVLNDIPDPLGRGDVF